MKQNMAIVKKTHKQTSTYLQALPHSAKEPAAGGKHLHIKALALHRLSSK